MLAGLIEDFITSSGGTNAGFDNSGIQFAMDNVTAARYPPSPNLQRGQ